MGVCGSSAAGDPNVVSLEHFQDETIILGVGGFGKVKAVMRKPVGKFKAKDDGTWYAMKQLGKEAIVKTANVKMVFNERDLLIKISPKKSCWIANIHYAFQDPQSCFLVLDLSEGGDLQFQLEKTNGKNFSPEQTRQYVAGIALGLQFLHDNNIVHRDIKPPNILLDLKGFVKITDLGISAELDKDGLTKHKSGTRLYMAPEIFLDGGSGIPVDYYSLGCCCYAFLLGHPPMARKDSNAKKYAIRGGEYNNSGSRTGSNEAEGGTVSYKGIDDKTVTFIRRLMDPNPECRLGSKGGIEQMKKEPYFEGFGWAEFEKQETKTLFQPSKEGNNFDTGDGTDMLCDLFHNDAAPVAVQLTPAQAARMKEYDWNVDTTKEQGQA